MLSCWLHRARTPSMHWSGWSLFSTPTTQFLDWNKNRSGQRNMAVAAGCVGCGDTYKAPVAARKAQTRSEHGYISKYNTIWDTHTCNSMNSHSGESGSLKGRPWMNDQDLLQCEWRGWMVQWSCARLDENKDDLHTTTPAWDQETVGQLRGRGGSWDSGLIVTLLHERL